MATLFTLAISILYLGCATLQPLLAPSYDYPPLPAVGTAAERDSLERLTRRAVSEVDDTKRQVALVELAALVRRLAPRMHRDDNYEPIADYIARTTLVAAMNRQYAGDAEVPEVQALAERVPAELVALRVTHPRNFVAAGARYMHDEATVVERVMRSAGAFERRGEGEGQYEYIAPFMWQRGSAAFVEDETYDAFLRNLFADRRLAAAELAIDVELRAGQKNPDLAERSVVVKSEVRAVENLVRKAEDLQQLAVRDKTNQRVRQELAALDEQIAQALIKLAAHPEWGVHLYIRGRVLTPQWQTPEVLEAVRAHKNPLSTRMFEGIPAEETRKGTNIPPPF